MFKVSKKLKKFFSYLPPTTENHICKSVDEWYIKPRREITQNYGCKPVVRGLFKNKRVFLLFLFFVFLSFFIPLKPVWAIDITAAIVNGFINVLLFVPSIIFFVFLLFLLPFSMISLIFSIGILKVVISPDFLKGISYTNPANNPLISAGLSITQSFANIILVLVLVFIALATILRLAGYETKKLLVTFIIVALLVNFAPVISGLVVDASNIVMNSFLRKTASFGVVLSNLESLKNTLLEKTWNPLKVPKELAFSLFVVVAFNFIFSLIFIIFTLIFLFRSIAIWILVILSPLAFVCYILPNTKQWAQMWWKQLIHWSIIGITCAFFLYLSQKMKVPTPNFKGPGNEIVPYLVPLAFLFLALVFGLQTSAIGASMIISGGKKAGKWVGRKVGRGAGKFIEEKFKLRERVGKAVTRAEKVPVLRWFVPEVLKKYSEARPAIEEAMNRTNIRSTSNNLQNAFSGAVIGEEAAAAILTTIKRGDANDIFTEGKKYFNAATNDELLNNPKFRKIMQKIIQKAKSAGMHNDILRSEPRLARLLAGTDYAPDEEKAVARAVSEAREQHIANMEPEVFEDPLFTKAALAHFDRERWLLVNRKIKNGQKSAQKAIDEIFTEFVNGLKKSGQFTDIDNAQVQFKNHIKENYDGAEGYFQAMGDERFEKTGWKYPTYLETGSTPPPPTPGGPTPGGPTPPMGTKGTTSLGEGLIPGENDDIYEFKENIPPTGTKGAKNPISGGSTPHQTLGVSTGIQSPPPMGTKGAKRPTRRKK